MSRILYLPGATNLYRGNPEIPLNARPLNTLPAELLEMIADFLVPENPVTAHLRDLWNLCRISPALIAQAGPIMHRHYIYTSRLQLGHFARTVMERYYRHLCQSQVEMFNSTITGVRYRWVKG